jgi:hypothetical protein
MEFPDKVAIAFDTALKQTGEAFRSATVKVAPVLLRFLLVLLFIWYLVEFCIVLGREAHWFWAVLLGLALLGLLTLLVWSFCVATKLYKENKPDKAQVPTVLPYVYVNFIPIAMAGLATCFHWSLPTPLLRFTQKIFEAFV